MVSRESEFNLHLSNQCRILYPLVGLYLHSQTLQINLGFFIALVACVNYSPKWVNFVAKNFFNYKKLAILGSILCECALHSLKKYDLNNLFIQKSFPLRISSDRMKCVSRLSCVQIRVYAFEMIFVGLAS